MDWMLMPLRKYAQFSGRSQRKEYWMYLLLVVIASVVAAIIDRLLGFGRTQVVNTPTVSGAAWQSYGPVQAILFLGTVIPSIAVAVRRLHDVDRTGWWVLAPLIPYVLGTILMVSAAMSAGGPSGAGLGGLAAGGVLMFIGFILAIVLLVFYCLDGTKGTNRFGPDPKGHMSDLADRFS